jgi:hypothetical protein
MKLALAALAGALVAGLAAAGFWFMMGRDNDAHSTSAVTCNEVRALMINAVDRGYGREELYRAVVQTASGAEATGDLEVARILRDFADARLEDDLGKASVAIDQLTELCPPSG